jgi:hypothetical protein
VAVGAEVVTVRRSVDTEVATAGVGDCVGFMVSQTTCGLLFTVKSNPSGTGTPFFSSSFLNEEINTALFDTGSVVTCTDEVLAILCKEALTSTARVSLAITLNSTTIEDGINAVN